MIWEVLLSGLKKLGWKGSRKEEENMNEWNAEEWKNQFKMASENKDYYLIHELRKEVFDNTKKCCENYSYVVGEKEIYLPIPRKSKVFKRPVHVAFFTSPSYQQGEKVKIHVLNEDCLATARRLSESGMHPFVLNMANRQNPGGGVENGAGAQEECLFRSSNYYQTLYQARGSYPLDRNWGSVLSHDVTVFRGLEEDGYPLLEKPFTCSFMAIPAINHPELDENGKMTKPMIKGTHNKIKTIYYTAFAGGAKVLVLSAFGCGAFKNPPEQIAEIFKDELKAYDRTFEDVYFSIKPDHNDPSNKNFKAFEKVLSGCVSQ